MKNKKNKFILKNW